MPEKNAFYPSVCTVKKFGTIPNEKTETIGYELVTKEFIDSRKILPSDILTLF